jgi:hypothetical protein
VAGREQSGSYTNRVLCGEAYDAPSVHLQIADQNGAVHGMTSAAKLDPEKDALRLADIISRYRSHNFALSRTLPQYHLRDRLAESQVPTLVLVGRHHEGMCFRTQKITGSSVSGGRRSGGVGLKSPRVSDCHCVQSGGARAVE